MDGIETPEGGAPLTVLSINHEATVDLDSTNAFEGKHCLHPVILAIADHSA